MGKSIENIPNLLRSLTPEELRILHLIYEINDFDAIRTSALIFSDRSPGTIRRVWRTVYKFSTLNLIDIRKSGAYIDSLTTSPEVADQLQSTEFDLVDQNMESLELALMANDQSWNNEYVTEFSPTRSFSFKMGCTYRLKANVSEDRNLILRINSI